MGVLSQDSVGHRTQITGTQLTAGAVSTTAVGTVAGTTAAGAAPTVAFVAGTTCTDAGGRFTLNPVTGGGAQAAGEVAVVTFANPYPRLPAVVVSMSNTTDTTGAIVASATSITTGGFKLCVGTALTTAKAYEVTFQVIP